jgi:selT/selW/selH-like putative selenoprotein
LADILRSRYDGIEVELIESGGGAFEVRHEGELVYSKLREGRFPNDEEIFELLGG